MSQNALVQAKETDLVVRANNNNRYAFISEGKRYEGVLDVFETDEGPSALLNGEEYPIFEGAFGITLVQSQHGGSDPKFKKHAGEIYVQDVESFSEERKLLPISIVREGRHLFPAYSGNGDNTPICQSFNGLVPSSYVNMPISPVCAHLVVTDKGRVTKEAVCSHAVWEDGKPAECKNFYDVAFLDITDESVPLPVVMRFKSKAIATLRDLRSSLDRKKRAARAIKSKTNNGFYILLKSEDKGNYYIPSMTLVDVPEGEASPSRLTPLCCYYRDTIFANTSMHSEEVIDAANRVSEEERLEAIDVSSENLAGSEGVSFTLNP